jgi:hypothetical protein
MQNSMRRQQSSRVNSEHHAISRRYEPKNACNSALGRKEALLFVNKSSKKTLSTLGRAGFAATGPV